MTFCILIPTINRKDLLLGALDWYLANLPETEIIVLDNGKQGIVSGHPNLKVFEPKSPKGVAASWNWLIRRAKHRGHTTYLILNDDVILQRTESEILYLIQKYGALNNFIRPQVFYNWSAFLINDYIFQKVGEFDESFQKCFFEDNDYEYRMRLAEINIRYEEALNPQVYLNSQSTLKDPLLGDYITNREYFIQKWGGLPTEEKYRTPFNK